MGQRTFKAGDIIAHCERGAVYPGRLVSVEVDNAENDGDESEEEERGHERRGARHGKRRRSSRRASGGAGGGAAGGGKKIGKSGGRAVKRRARAGEDDADEEHGLIDGESLRIDYLGSRSCKVLDPSDEVELWIEFRQRVPRGAEVGVVPLTYRLGKPSGQDQADIAVGLMQEAKVVAGRRSCRS